MQRRTRRVIAVLAIVLAAPFVLVTLVELAWAGRQVRRLREQLENAVHAALPVGAAKDDVIAFFDRAEWQHHFDAGRRVVHAVKHELGVDLLVDTALSVTVELDDAMKVRQVRTEYFYCNRFA
jgi:hypothetical protein